MKRNALLLLFPIALASCRSQTKIISNAPISSHQVTTTYPLFFNAENARVLGNTNEALMLYTEFVRLYPNNATACFNLSRLQFQKMDLAKAEKNSEQSVKLDPENKFFREFYTKILLIAKKPKEAMKQYDILIEKYPSEEEYVFDKAILLALLKKYDDAISCLNKLEARMGFNEDIIIQKKTIYLQQGKIDQAIAEIEKLKQANSYSCEYDIMIADLLSTDKQYARAEAVYKTIETKFANEGMGQVALAQHYTEKKDTANANRFLQLAMKNRNLDVETKIALLIPVLKQIEDDTLQRDQVINLAKSISEDPKGSPDALSLYADVLYFSRQFDQALNQYNKFLEKDKTRFPVWTQVISIYSEKQQSDSVIAVSKRCIDLFPKNSIPYYYAGVSYLQKHETDTAIPYLSKGLSLEKDNILIRSQFYSSLGEAYNTLKEYRSSDSCFEEAIRLQPGDATALNNYAYYLSLRMERLDIAEKMSFKSLEIQPNSKSFLDTYGWILFQQGKYTEALTYIQRAIQANGETDGTLHEHLGDVYSKLGDAEHAKASWNKAKELGENNPLLLKKIQYGAYFK